MRSRNVGLFLLGVLVLSPLAAQAQAPEASFKPTVLLRLRAIEELAGDLRHLATKVGQEEVAKQVEALLKSRTGPKGLEGIDPKKPLGLYGTVHKELNKSEGVLLLPIADEKTFLDFLDNLDLKPAKSKDGLYTVEVPKVPFPVLFRFSRGYLYGTLKVTATTTLPAADQLPAPATVLASGAGALSLTVNIDQIPESVRKAGVTLAALQLNERKKDELPKATEKQKAVYEAVIDELTAQVKSLLEDGTRAMLKLDIDRKSEEVSLSFQLEGKPGSRLAKDIATLAPSTSLTSILIGKDSVMGGTLHLVLAERVRKALAPAIDEGVAGRLNDLDAEHRELLSPLLKTLDPTLKAGRLALGADMRGPAKGGKYTLVMGTQMEKGREVEKAVKTLLQKIPAQFREAVHLDVDKAAGFNIHRIDQKEVEPGAKELFGEGPVYLAFRDDGLLIALGENALPTLKETLALKAGMSQPVTVQLSLARLARLMAADNKHAPAVAKKAFTTPGSDRVRLNLNAGKRLELTFGVKTSALTFAALMDQARKAEKE